MRFIGSTATALMKAGNGGEAATCHKRDYTEDMKKKAETKVAEGQAVKMETLLEALNTLG
jgi:hypothetical protein